MSFLVRPLMSKTGIVIATRNREKDLNRLFSIISQEAKWKELPIWIHDDSSQLVSEFYWEMLEKESFFLLKNPNCLGYIVNRNISNASSPFDFIFSLDDDSCFVDADGPALAVQYLKENPNVAALGFPLVDSLTPSDPPTGNPFPCQTYIGCAHLIRKDIFLKLGGYRSDFVHQCEEPEFCTRIWNAGYEIHAFPKCRVHHWVSKEFRLSQRVGFYGPRNRVWSHFLHTPAIILPFEIAKAFGSYAKYSFSSKVPFAHLKGFLAGIFMGITTLKQREALTLEKYRDLTKLPLFPHRP